MAKTRLPSTISYNAPKKSKGGLSQLDSVVDGQNTSKEDREENPFKTKSLPKRLPSPNGESGPQGNPEDMGGSTPKDNEPSGGAALGKRFPQGPTPPQKGWSTPSNIPSPTTQPKKPAPSTMEPGNAGRSTMMDTGQQGSSSPLPTIQTDGSHPPINAPWDRPPLGGIAPNSWAPDDHFISNL